ncbi:flagellar basal-body rod protein FlgG [Burkholderia dolosa]|uniref:flagellar basal-body rod protein FlgG n=1 Tax=Burkholderia dolosa TaxID=152500 RepID=UPI0015901A2E|nr:flagellar basal-body rod protein FlgG [Burkholderia dolosa]MBR8460485.1 flagellar basal-body rod protein FlgG [Burkholderia dolosa]
MNHAMWISKTGIQAQDVKLQAIANNLANVNTVGFKRDRVAFEDLFYRAERQPGAQMSDNATDPGVQLGNGTRIAGTQKVFTNGALQETSQKFDVAIVGNGFLQVEMPNGEVGYTRAGQLRVNDQGRLTNAQGMPLVPGIDIPPGMTGITIGDNGMVSVTTGAGTTPVEVGQLLLVEFSNPAGLLAQGNNVYVETILSGAPTEGEPGQNGIGTLKQGALEGSNVLAVEEMVEMIAAQRTYEMNTKVLSAADNMMQYLSQAAR